MNQFDPNFPGLFEGDITDVVVIDPVLQGNRVINSAREFQVRIVWKIFGTDVPNHLGNAGPNWDVSVYAEGVGASPEVLLGNVSVPVNPPTRTCPGVFCHEYETTITVAPGTLEPHFPSDPRSGIYKIAAAVFLDSTVPGGDMIGFKEGPVIMAEPL